MPTRELALTYDGPALEGHEMDIRDLAPSLLAVGEMFDAASRLLYPKLGPVVLRVRDKVTPGSFGLELNVTPKQLQTLLEWLGPHKGDGGVFLEGLIGAVLAALGVVIAARTGKIQKVMPSAEPGHTRVIFANGAQVDTTQQVAAILQDRLVMADAAKALQPLDRDGIEQVTFAAGPALRQEVRKHELTYFLVNADGFLGPEVVSEAEMTGWWAIVSPVFREDNKWRLSDGGEWQFRATIADDAFLARVELGEPFAKGDQLHARLRTKVTRSGADLRSEYTIVEVLDHFRRPLQARLADRGPVGGAGGRETEDPSSDDA